MIESVDFFLWARLHCTETALLTIMTFFAAILRQVCHMHGAGRENHGRGERSPQHHGIKALGTVRTYRFDCFDFRIVFPSVLFPSFSHTPFTANDPGI